MTIAMQTLTLRVTPQERETLRAASQTHGRISMSAFIRNAALKEAEKVLLEAYQNKEVK